MLAATSLICADEAAPDLICSVCLDTWRRPVELKPCSHIFCDECINHVPPIQKCPECRCFIEAFKAPNRVLTRLAEQVKVVCGGCQWKGTREQSIGHRCFVAPKGVVAPTVKLHSVTEGVAKQLATYFVSFGGVTGSTVNGEDVIISKRGFFDLMMCFNYGDNKEDLDKIYNAVRNVLPPPPRDRLAEQVKVVCGGCQWKGTREQSIGHRCFVAPKGVVAPTVKLHSVTEGVAKQLATYFVSFGGVTGSTVNGEDVIISKRGFFDLMMCFNYGDNKEDLDKIYNAVRNVLPPPPRDGSVSVRSLCAFLAKYPADPKRLYKLNLEDYHTCMYALHEWFTKRNDAKAPILLLNEQTFTPKEFIEFAVLHKFLAPFESSKEQKRAEGHWMPMVDVVDKDGKVSRHEALRFMSSCIRVSSLRDDNFEEHLCNSGDVAASPELPRGSGTQCCSVQ
ncbi:zinc finger protein, putative [Bodo saltans]|uniref:Zinc finger protein, putative n=1 Tax=Bodo saltans TaxID=75058 RepID=A0A0S4JBP2_BODSA|nr:zinc finger protein, putative [Bodo saltans]|eukprot:CUG87793.1 zinc finger protein, putative [Bodo saltans]